MRRVLKHSIFRWAGRRSALKVTLLFDMQPHLDLLEWVLVLQPVILLLDGCVKGCEILSSNHTGILCFPPGCRQMLRNLLAFSFIVLLFLLPHFWFLTFLIHYLLCFLLLKTDPWFRRFNARKQTKAKQSVVTAQEWTHSDVATRARGMSATWSNDWKNTELLRVGKAQVNVMWNK